MHLAGLGGHQPETGNDERGPMNGELPFESTHVIFHVSCFMFPVSFFMAAGKRGAGGAVRQGRFFLFALFGFACG
jgi:hypothetical protein